MRVIFLFVLVFISLVSIINAQGSLSSCTYNGIDYSFLGNQSYSSTDPNNQYTYYFGVCKIPPKCNLMNLGNVVACQIKNNGTVSNSIGLISQGTFVNYANYGVLLNYKTQSNPCSDGTFRNINIYLVPGNASRVSQTIEENKCTYGVTIQYPRSSSSSSFSSSDYGSSSESSEGGKIVCEKSNKGLKIQSFTNISCSSYGATYCVDSNNSTCETDQSDGEIKCSTKAKDGQNEISCRGSNISCSSGGLVCSINLASIDLNNAGNVIKNSNGSIKLTFNIVVILLIVSLTLLL